jgi:deoxyribodipyrimidine photo-lyase
MERSQHTTITLFWYRRDLRLNDNTALIAALSRHKNVQPIFIFDTEILDDLDKPNDRRVSFIYESIESIKKQLVALGCDLWVFHGTPLSLIQKLLNENKVEALYANGDYEPYAGARDESIGNLCHGLNVPFSLFKDQVVFEKLEIAKDNGAPYTVFTPYMRKWKTNLQAQGTDSKEYKPLIDNFNQMNSPTNLLKIEQLGFNNIDHGVGTLQLPLQIIKNYNATRDMLAVEGTSRLSVHLRFGTISIRELVKVAYKQNETYLNELIWREFYMQILWNFPHVVTQSFKPMYDVIPWNTSELDFEKWCVGKTGYPIVDAAMHQLLQTGFMHNRARMIVASFLTKHLLIDWRKGESFFAKYLTDYELSSNNGGWQWASSSGCDAVPYFRIFNPELQTQKFDPDREYIKKWGGEQGLKPIIEHKEARERCLLTYKKALNG